MKINSESWVCLYKDGTIFTTFDGEIISRATKKEIKAEIKRDASLYNIDLTSVRYVKIKVIEIAE